MVWCVDEGRGGILLDLALALVRVLTGGLALVLVRTRGGGYSYLYEERKKEKIRFKRGKDKGHDGGDGGGDEVHHGTSVLREGYYEKSITKVGVNHDEQDSIFVAK